MTSDEKQNLIIILVVLATIIHATCASFRDQAKEEASRSSAYKQGYSTSNCLDYRKELDRDKVQLTPEGLFSEQELTDYRTGCEQAIMDQDQIRRRREYKEAAEDPTYYTRRDY